MADADSRRLIRLAVLALVALAALVGVRQYRDERRRDYVVEQRNGVALSTIVATAFADKSDLRVMQISGVVQSVATHAGAISILDSDKVVKAPFTADYFLDVSKLSPSSYRYDPATRSLIVTAPPITVDGINIDEAHDTVVRTRGLIVTRGAEQDLSRKTSTYAAAQVTAEANKPANIVRARENARRVVAAMLRPALAAAGVPGVQVVVRFADEGGPQRERWDVSRSIANVLLPTEHGS